MSAPEDKPDTKPQEQSKSGSDKDQKSTPQSQDDDQPGADGPSSAGASQDTYD